MEEICIPSSGNDQYILIYCLLLLSQTNNIVFENRGNICYLDSEIDQMKILATSKLLYMFVEVLISISRQVT